VAILLLLLGEHDFKAIALLFVLRIGIEGFLEASRSRCFFHG